MDNIELTTAELVWLFASLRAEAAIGVDTALLFPERPDVQDELYKEGLESLRARDLIVPGKKPGRENVVTELSLIIDLIARPRLAVVTERRDAGRRQRVSHYLDDRDIVEVVDRGEGAAKDRRHLIHRVKDVPTMLLRILEMTDTPESHPFDGVAAEMNNAVFKKIKDLVDAGQAAKAAPALKKLGLTEDATINVIEALKDPDRAGVISLFEVDNTTIIDARMLAFFASDDGAWVADKPSMTAPALRLKGVARKDLWAILAEDLRDLVETAPQP